MTAFTDTDSENPLHATSVAIDGAGIILLGKSGCGKSDLALRLIDRGALLISDDYTLLEICGDRLYASPPATIAGKMEVRHIGIVVMPHLHNVPVALAIRLDDKPERMPDPNLRITLQGVAVPLIRLDAFDASAAIKVELALRALESPLGEPTD